MNQQELDVIHDQNIIKANKIIQNAQFSLSVRQYKILSFFISKIKKGDTHDTKYNTTITEIAEVCNLSLSGKNDWERIRNDLKRLAMPEWGVTIDGDEATMSWIQKAKRIKGTDKIEIKFDEDMAEYLFLLKDNFTKYKLGEIIVFKSKYTIRLYEIVRSWAGQHRLEEQTEKGPIYHKITFMMDVDELRKRLDPNNTYEKWNAFSQKVLKLAVDEINDYNEDIHVDIEMIKEKRVVTKVRFTVMSTYDYSDGYTTEQVKERVDAHNRIHERIGRGVYIGKPNEP